MSCAPKVSPPLLYKDTDLSLKEIIAIAQREVTVLKIVASVTIEKNDNAYTNIDASLLFKRHGWLHIRVYKLGILAGDFLIKDDMVYAEYGKKRSNSDEILIHDLSNLGKELYSSVFWWENLENALMYKEGKTYIIKAKNKEIQLNKSTLLPVRQDIYTKSKKIHISYDEPEKVAVTATRDSSRSDFWYPSVIKIKIGMYRVTVKVKRVFVNPPLGENDFKISR